MLGSRKPLAETDLIAIEARAQAIAIVLIGYLVTALSGSLAPAKGEEQAYLIATLCDDDVTAFIAEVRRLRAESLRLWPELVGSGSATWVHELPGSYLIDKSVFATSQL